MDDADALGWALERWAAGRDEPTSLFGDPTPITGGFDTRIWAFTISSGGARRDLVVRIYPSPEREAGARQEAETISRLHDAGYPVPALLDCGGAREGPFGLPYLVMERAAGRNAAGVMGRQPHKITPVIEVLARTQAALHLLPADTLGEPSATTEVDRRLNGVVTTDLTEDMTQGMAWLADTAAAARHADDACCHYDFHPMNVLIDPQLRPTVIDWVGAGVGDRHSDLARSVVLFTWARALAPARFQRAVLRWATPTVQRRWIAAYDQRLGVDHAALNWWVSFHALDGWVQTAVRAGDDDPRRHAAGPLRALFLQRFRAGDRTA